MALSAFLRHGPTLATVPFNSLFSVDPSLPKIKLESENIDPSVMGYVTVDR